MKIFKILPVVALMAAFSGCVNDDVYNAPDTSGLCTDIPVTAQVSEVFTPALPAYPNFVQYTEDDVIEAYVTSSDEGGTFYKSISMVSLDGTMGFSIPVDNYNLYNMYEPGRKVFVKLKDLYVSRNNGYQAGALYNGNTPEDPDDDSVGRLSGATYANTIIRSCEKVDEETLVNHLTVAQAKNDANLNKLIEIDNVQFTDASIGKKYFDESVNNLGGATNHLISDGNGTVIFRVSEFANFAGDPIPTSNGKIRGVMTKFGSDYQFLARTKSDIMLTDSRVVPAFEETFSTNFPNWVKVSVVGTQAWVLDATHGNPGACAKMSGFQSGNFANEDWLISPSIDLTDFTAATLTFDTAKNFAGNNLEVFISTNYSGSGDPAAATWTPLTATLSTTGFTWTGSGAIDISSLAGQNNVRVAYKYTSTASASATWEVDNVKVIAQ